jgi:hypothetical protein
MKNYLHHNLQNAHATGRAKTRKNDKWIEIQAGFGHH